MKHREPILRKLESIESSLNKTNLFLNRGDRDGARETLEQIREHVEQIRLYINNEPIVGHELNG